MVNKWQAFGEMLRACFVYGTKKGSPKREPKP